MDQSSPQRPAGKKLDEALLHRMDLWWRAANYLSVGQIYLLANPLLREPLAREHVKRRLLGLLGSTPGLNFIWVHLNRLIRERDLNVIYIAGPGHGAPGLFASTWLEGSYSELSPLVAHAFGAAFDNPDLLVACVIGDGAAETGPLATSWHGNKFLNPATDGAILPILHLNGYKIANPTILARIEPDELRGFLATNGCAPFYVEGEDPAAMPRLMAVALDQAAASIADIQQRVRAGDGAAVERPPWPMIVLRSPRGWTCPKEVDGLKLEGTWRAHQVPIADTSSAAHLALLESWTRSYRPEKLFDDVGRPATEITRLAPEGPRRMGANPHTNGGVVRPLHMPDFAAHAVSVPSPRAVDGETTHVLGEILHDAMQRNRDLRNFRVFGPDETASNRRQAVFEATDCTWLARPIPGDDHLSPDGRVMEILSEHTCQGWLEGYLLTGRHGLFNCHEAFIHIVDSMFTSTPSG